MTTLHGRCLHGGVLALSSFHVSGQSSLDAHLQDNYAEGEHFL
nr:MAG TPA: hypothetical protein [Caudoviricetes sp.]